LKTYTFVSFLYCIICTSDDVIFSYVTRRLASRPTEQCSTTDSLFACSLLVRPNSRGEGNHVVNVNHIIAHMHTELSSLMQYAWDSLIWGLSHALTHAVKISRIREHCSRVFSSAASL